MTAGNTSRRIKAYIEICFAIIPNFYRADELGLNFDSLFSFDSDFVNLLLFNVHFHDNNKKNAISFTTNHRLATHSLRC